MKEEHVKTKLLKLNYVQDFIQGLDLTSRTTNGANASFGSFCAYRLFTQENVF